MPAEPVFMTEKTLNALKGWPQPAAVDFHSRFDDAALAALGVTRVEQGSVVRLSATGLYLLGVGNINCMPMFTFQASDDPDVLNYGGNPATKKGAWIPVSPTGQVMALPANGAYELVSTAFIEADRANLVPNALLTSPSSGANAGRIGIGIKGTNLIIGICSRGIVDNGYGYDAVAFWPHIFFV